MEKKINYLSRDFNSIRNELNDLTKRYYPELSDAMNDASVGAWITDLVAAVGDDLSYHTDRMYQETNVNSANLRSTVLNLARVNGVKVPGPKVAMCEVEFSCRLPINPKDIAMPDWDYAPTIKRDSKVSAGSCVFELTEDVNFAEQFNSDGFSNRKFEPLYNNNGIPYAYLVKKTTIVRGGTTKVMKKVVTQADAVPFMEVVLPDTDIVGVESILFKENGDFSVDPSVSEYYIDEECFRLTKQSISTYRFFEVDSLSDQYRLGVESSTIDGNVISDMLNPVKYEDYYEDGVPMVRCYKAKWKGVRQKFITEYTDNGYLKVIFGCGNEDEKLPDDMTNYGEYRLSNVINNDMLGVIPMAGWVMYIMYRIGGGLESNIAKGTMNKVNFGDIVIPSINATDQSTRSTVIKSITVTNNATAIGGKDMPSTEELKNLVKYCVGSQRRCVTLKDYKARVAEIPGKFGCPYRANFIDENNKVVMSVLNINKDGKLTKALPTTMVDNIEEYLSHYKNITDYIEIRSGRIYNLGVEVDAFVDKNYDTSDVVGNIIERVKGYLDVGRWDMGEDIFVGDLEREVNSIDGVVNLIDLRIYAIYNGEYSSDQCPLPRYDAERRGEAVGGFSKTSDGADSYRIDLESTDQVLYSEYNSMYEIANPKNDIVVRVKLK